MSKNFAFIFVVIIALLSGCQSPPKTKVVQISAEQAKSVVQQYHEKNSSFGEAEITSIKHINNEYKVTWERKSNCESGTDYVNDKDGTIARSEVSIC
ncbi:hypothetical protein G5B47_13440 [Paenibacillus sp. 7124]|uniref:PepSY domain-containing protein n=1 Tax=Paenibacillus apii TaxID=1850370 RepID=A0A6M1PT53_9BACL|nr:hypothetical protein [Paenibacillus apii]NGM83421.1 hypothetical protein [Paenibacillus apii]NJJ39052.1 hypothetical protein [Paenibacillus apii]